MGRIPLKRAQSGQTVPEGTKSFGSVYSLTEFMSECP
jgi:hypothetical protein